jgi:MoaA/NifB/PqqE/SkfB family radical SAM enzyme
MEMHTLIAACELARDHGDHICLGGGEPTIHPRFWEFFWTAKRYHDAASSGLSYLIITNGSMTDIALKLADMTVEGGDIEAVLSQDQWHDPIDPRVVRRYEQLRNYRSRDGHRQHEAIRTNERITPHGSALKNGLNTSDDECCCEDMRIHPTGRIYGCGCGKVQFGNVFQPAIPEWFEWRGCAVKQKKAHEQELRAQRGKHTVPA